MADETASPDFRRGAALALGDLRCEQAVATLSNALADTNLRMRMGAVIALGSIGSDDAVSGLELAQKNDDGYIRNLAYDYLIKLKPERKISLAVKALTDGDWETREKAVKDLQEAGEAVVDLLIKELSKPDLLLHWEIARILAKVKSQKTASVLLEMLHENDAKIRNQAAVALIAFDSDKITDTLINLLHDKNEAVREEAIRILGEKKAERAVNFLTNSLDDKNSGWLACSALGKIGSEKSVKPLVNLLTENAVQKRRTAVWALNRIQSPKTVKPLIKVLQDSDDEVRLLASLALEGIGTPEALAAIKTQ